MATRKCGNIYFPKYFMAVRPFLTRILFQELFGLEGLKNFLETFHQADSYAYEKLIRKWTKSVFFGFFNLMGTRMVQIRMAKSV